MYNVKKRFYLLLMSHFTARRYMLARYMLSPCVRPSVCMFICHKPELYQNIKTQDHAKNAIR